MKKLFSIVTLLTLLLSLVSCTASTTAETTFPSPPASTSEPPPASNPLPPPEPLTEAERIDLLASFLETAMGEGSFELSGTVELVDSSGDESAFAVSGCYALADPPEASLLFVTEAAEVLGCELYLKDRVLYLLRERTDGAPTLVRFSELDAYRTLCERSEEIVSMLAELRDLLSERAPELDALFSLSEKSISSAELLSLVSLLGRSYTDGLKALGVELEATFENESSVRDAAKALYDLCADGYDDGKETLTLTPTYVLTLVSSLYTELEARLDRTVTSILDETLGEGQTAELYRRLASFRGSDLLSLWREEVETILVSEGLSLDLFYEVLASVLDRSMSAEMTPQRLMKLLDENAEKSLDKVISLLWDDQTYAGLLQDLHSILSMPPTSLYTAFGGVGDLRDRLRSEKERFALYADALDLSVTIDFDGGTFSLAELAFGFDRMAEPGASGEPSCVGISLALVFRLSDRLPTPSEQLKHHPDFGNN